MSESVLRTDPPPAPIQRPESELAAALPYLAPMLVYMITGAIENGLLDHRSQQIDWLYPLTYAARVVATLLVCWIYRATWRDLRPWPRPQALILACSLGVLVIAGWVGLDGRYPTFSFLGSRIAFNPTGLQPAPRLAFLLVRLLGLVAVVPLIEELFWRSFLIRWLQNTAFQTIPIGSVTLASATGTAALFALVHPEWLPALLTGLAWAWLLKQTRSLAACTLSHAVANATLVAYVLSSGDWKYW